MSHFAKILQVLRNFEESTANFRNNEIINVPKIPTERPVRRVFILREDAGICKPKANHGLVRQIKFGI